MLLNVSQLYKNPDFVLEFAESVNFDDEFSKEKITFPSPVEVKGNIKNVGGILILSASVSGKYETFCDRCGKSIVLLLDFEFEETFKKEGDILQDDEANVVLNEQIDFFDIVVKNVFSNFPLKKLCSENCKGVCQRCGADLNLGECKCQNTDNFNPHFDILKDLFD